MTKVERYILDKNNQLVTILELLAAGKGATYISKLLGVDRSNVQRLKRNHPDLFKDNK